MPEEAIGDELAQHPCSAAQSAKGLHLRQAVLQLLAAPRLDDVVAGARPQRLPRAFSTEAKAVTMTNSVSIPAARVLRTVPRHRRRHLDVAQRQVDVAARELWRRPRQRPKPGPTE